MISFTRFSIVSICAGMAFAAGLSAPRVEASDIEVFFSTPTTSSAKPNVLFILDTSQSMFTKEPAAENPYDPSVDYDGICEDDKYYWTSSTGGTPDCGSGWAEVTDTEFACPSWRASVDANGYATVSPSRVAQYDGSKWVALSTYPNQRDYPIACEGDTTPDPIVNWGAKNKGKPIYPAEAHTFYSGRWLNWFNDKGGLKYRIDIVREAVGRLITNTQGIKVGLMRYGYDGDRIFETTPNTATACAVLQDGVEGSRSSNGAPVVFPVTDLDAAAVPGFIGGSVREQIRYQLGIDSSNQPLGWTVNASLDQADQPFQVVRGNGPDCGGNATIPLMTPGGRSPIGGAMYESYLYYSGSEWSQKYGKQADLGAGYSYPSVEQSRLPNSETYKSPIVDDCAKNFIILLSDGTTEQDNDVDGPISSLPNFEQITGSKSCDADLDPPTNDKYWADNGVDWTPPPSQCVDDAAELMFETDMDGNPDNGIQNVITYTIGFALGRDPLANAARTLLSQTATRGGGSFLEAGSAQELEDVLGQVVRSILTENTSFSAPAVTVNAFNRTQNLNDLYMSLFRPAFNYAWTGNIKKYQLDPIDGDILDATGNPAVDPASGFFLKASRSVWSAATDGDDIALGGAASQLKSYSTRTFLTEPASGPNPVDLDSVGLIDADVGIQTGDYLVPAVASSGALTADDLVAWFYGKDIGDENGNSITAETRQAMGDPLHAKPVTVVYGGTAASPNLNDAALFAVTNDGVLHAIDPGSGVDFWSFVPRDQLARMRDLYYNAKLSDPEDRGYGLDGDISVLRIDLNRNGIVEPTVTQDLNADNDTTDFGEKEGVYLFMGQRRGGSKYMAFDVSNKNSPKHMWTSSYPLGGQSWSTPQPARVRIGSAYKWVLFFGGGYDTTQDQQPYATDSVGRGLYMVDAQTGTLLWRAGPDGGADLQLAGMTHSSPANVRVFDLTGDGFDDRLYMSDLGGRIWRFDIFNGKPVAAAEGARLMEGGLIASLGNAGDATPAAANTIRFFYSPDPALITKPGPNYINIAIGSGHRELPASDLTSVNWFFSVRDFNVYTQMRSSWYQNDCSTSTTPCHEILDEDDLEDLTSTVGLAAETAVPVATASPGWKIQLGVSGEKALSESRTFQDKVYFTTYAPETITSVSVACGTAFGQNRLYVVNAQDARPVNNYDAQVGESAADRSKKLAQGSIAPEVVFVFPTPPVDPNDPNAPQPSVPPVCLVGLENCGSGILNPPVRTYWWQHGSN